MALDALGFGNRRAQANRKIVREMIAANRDRAGVPYDSAAINDDFGGATANVEQADAEVAFVLSETGFGGSKRLENGVADEDAGFVGGSDEILRRGDRRRDDVNVGFKTLADHAEGVADAVLRVDAKFMGEDVEDFAVGRERDVASGVDGAANVVAFDVAGAITKSDAAAAVDAADVAASYPNDGGFD